MLLLRPWFYGSGLDTHDGFLLSGGGYKKKKRKKKKELIRSGVGYERMISLPGKFGLKEELKKQFGENDDEIEDFLLMLLMEED